jgi:hypothetical protein
MGIINGKQETIKRVREATPGDPSVYISIEAISQLPDDVEAVIVEVPFYQNFANDKDEKNSFSNVGTDTKPSYYPKTNLMYSIAEARGISADPNPLLDPLYEDVNISEMEMAQVPVIQKKKVGYTVKRSGTVIQDDGTTRACSHIGIFNAWDECTNLWATEEKWTEGYSKKGKYDNKYQSKWNRRLHFQEQLDKSPRMADSTSWLKCIRDLAGLKTGFTKEDLKEGKFYFAKIRRSEMVRKAETAARLACIAGGVQQQQIESPYEAPAAPQQPMTVTIVPEPEPVQDPRQTFIGNLEVYLLQGLVPADLVDVAGKIKDWLNGHADAVQDAWWSEAVKRLKAIEDRIPAELRIGHKIY